MEIELLAPSTPDDEPMDIHALEPPLEAGWDLVAAALPDPGPGPSEQSAVPEPERWSLYEEKIRAEDEEVALAARREQAAPNFPTDWFDAHVEPDRATESAAVPDELRRPHSPPTVAAPAVEPLDPGVEPLAPVDEPMAPAEDLPAPVPRAIVAQAAMAVLAALPDLLLGRRASTQERESREAEAELRQNLEQPRPGNHHLGLPICVDPRREGSENWDEEGSVDMGHLIRQEPAPPLRRRRSSARGLASRYNPRRHLELEDLESMVTRPRRPSPTTPGKRQDPPPARHHGGRRNTRGRQPRPDAERPPERRPQQGPPAPNRRDTAAELPVRMRGVRFGDLTPIPTDRRVDPEPFHCFNCWQRGHNALQCTRQQ